MIFKNEILMKIKTTKKMVKITFKFKRNNCPKWLRKKLISTAISVAGLLLTPQFIQGNTVETTGNSYVRSSF